MIVYVYAIGEEIDPAGLKSEPVDDGAFDVATAAGISALYSPVDADRFSQEEIDRHAKDLEWLGAIGYRHQAVVSALARKTTIVPLRAFTLFKSKESLEEFLRSDADSLKNAISRLRGKEEWTLRIELEPEAWSNALITRVDSLRAIAEEVAKAPAGKGYLLQKKLDEEKKKAARTAEETVVAEIRDALGALDVPTVVESRQSRGGSFPQINLLVERERSVDLERTRDDLARRYAADGISLVLTGPWPPYTFASEKSDAG